MNQQIFNLLQDEYQDIKWFEDIEDSAQLYVLLKRVQLISTELQRIASEEVCVCEIMKIEFEAEYDKCRKLLLILDPVLNRENPNKIVKHENTEVAEEKIIVTQKEHNLGLPVHEDFILSDELKSMGL